MRYGPSTKERLIVEDLKIDGFEDLVLVKWCIPLDNHNDITMMFSKISSLLMSTSSLQLSDQAEASASLPPLMRM